MPSLMQKLQAKLELFRLEQRYTRNRHRRSTFVSNAVYVDGEYVYQTPNSTGSSNSSSSTPPIEEYESERRRNSLEAQRSPVHQAEMTPAQRKRLNRFSSMPGFGTSTKVTSRGDFRSNTIDVREVR
ncbi:uncharacterized protein B0I36DRAFT_363681 [Microdochium trichocladiopsis]|uniref:Uncharacterized protein n=1 Tax=Microdochium trichocladiopsis TaxID=1682393 RepID=A0A9P8Y6Q7_9PEZI|nr:uncharacterized protein B0I36DRAFT_363681 [Microdochium trichocladiopsis]KAH7029092.1 hypothetical protein B0I36DRAFT_363681 [Microdochium trichocladiopsis]